MGLPDRWRAANARAVANMAESPSHPQDLPTINAKEGEGEGAGKQSYSEVETPWNVVKSPTHPPKE